MTLIRKPDANSEFRLCPQCGSEQIYQTDYELEDGTVDTNGRACEKCNWEGDRQELVSAEGK